MLSPWLLQMDVSLYCYQIIVEDAASNMFQLALSSLNFLLWYVSLWQLQLDAFFHSQQVVVNGRAANMFQLSLYQPRFHPILFQWQLQIDASFYRHQIVADGSATNIFHLPLLSLIFTTCYLHGNPKWMPIFAVTKFILCYSNDNFNWMPLFTFNKLLLMVEPPMWRLTLSLQQL